MSKVMISDVEYETEIDHMNRSGVRIAVDARQTHDSIMSIFYGEAWAALKTMFDTQIYDYAQFWLIWGDLRQVDPYNDPENIERLRKIMVRHILDEIYDMEEAW